MAPSRRGDVIYTELFREPPLPTQETMPRYGTELAVVERRPGWFLIQIRSHRRQVWRHAWRDFWNYGDGYDDPEDIFERPDEQDPRWHLIQISTNRRDLYDHFRRDLERFG